MVGVYYVQVNKNENNIFTLIKSICFAFIVNELKKYYL